MYQSIVPASKPLPKKAHIVSESVFIVLAGNTPSVVFRKESDARAHIANRKEEYRKSAPHTDSILYWRIVAVELK